MSDLNDYYGGWSREDLKLYAANFPDKFAKLMRRREFESLEQQREKYEDSLIDFFARAWREVDPAKLNINWHHVEIALHLEDVTWGRTRSMIINIPPRHTKSILVNVLWLAWIWAQPPEKRGPLAGPHVKFLCVSYGATLAEEMALKMRRLITGEWYQRLWGDRVRLQDDQKNRANFENTAGGARISNSIEGGILGRGGDITIIDDPQTRKQADSETERAASLSGMSDLTTRVTDPRIHAQVLIMQRLHECLLPGTLVRVPEGERPIEALSVGDAVFGSKGWQAIECVGSRPYKGTAYGIRLFGHPNTAWVTDTHEYHTQRGWVRAENLTLEDWIRFPIVGGDQIGGTGIPWDEPRRAPPPIKPSGTFNGLRRRSVDRDALALLVEQGLTNTEIGKRLNVHRNTVQCYMWTYGLSRIRDRSPIFGRAHLETPAFWRLIGYWLAEGSTMRGRDETCGIRFSFGRHEEATLVADAISIIELLGLSAKKNYPQSVCCVEVCCSQLGRWCEEHFGKGAKTKRLPEFVFSLPGTCREQLMEGWLLGDGCYRNSRDGPERTGSSSSRALLHGFQRVAMSLGKRALVMAGGPARESYIGEQSVRNSGAGGELRFPIMQESINRRTKSRIEEGCAWHRIKAITTKHYDGLVHDITTPSHDFVVGNATVHNSDATDWALKNWPRNTVHLMFPARFEPLRACPGDPREREGELLWPAVWTEEELVKIENGLSALDGDVLSDYACTPAESPILMADLSLKPIGEVAVGDEVIGWGLDPDHKPELPAQYRRQRLLKTKVMGKFSYVGKVVKVTLDSGEVIRCTADHQWYQRKEEDRSEYLPAKIGRKLMRICPSSLPVLSGDDLRKAGWLAGFFDGEGTISFSRKPNGFRPSASIIFSQGAGRNLPLCEKLEEILTHFGFPWVCAEYIRADRIVSLDRSYLNRFYRLCGNKLPMYQRFLHIVQPAKWRQRCIEGALSTKWIVGKERVVSIEPDGEEPVFGLKTDTGNYVVWGLASKNCSGQLQQNPIPRGGGIINKDDWQMWPEWIPRLEDMTILPDGSAYIPLPPVSHVILSLDTAISEKETADWNACVVIGVWHRPRNLVTIVGTDDQIDDGEQPRAIMMGGWRRRCKLNDDTLGRDGRPLGLVQLVRDTCRRLPVDRIIIENKTRGQDVKNELERQFSGENFHVELFEPTKHGDKVARLYSVQPLFSQKLVYAPAQCKIAHLPDGSEYVDVTEFEWMRQIIAEVEAVPRGAHDDFADACFAAGTLIATRRGSVAIEAVRVGDEVVTPLGWRRVTAAGCTGWASTIDRAGLRGTAKHPTFTLENGYQTLDTVSMELTLSRLSLCGLIRTILRSMSSSREQPIAGWAARDDITCRSPRQMRDGRTPRGFMWPFGNRSMVARCRRATKLITTITIRLITILATWFAYQRVSIAVSLRTSIRKSGALLWLRLARRPRYGTDPRKAGHGIGGTLPYRSAPQAPPSPTARANQLRGFASGAEGRLNCFHDRLVSVGSHALALARNTSAAIARFLIPTMLPSGVYPPLSVVIAADYYSSCSLVSAGENSAVRDAAKAQQKPEPVYNLSVDGAECYYANGILVHNCSMGLIKLREDGLLALTQEYVRAQVAMRMVRPTRNTVRNAYGV